MQQMASQILNDGYMQLGAPTILITFDVLDFLRYEGPAENKILKTPRAGRYPVQASKIR